MRRRSEVIANDALSRVKGATKVSTGAFAGLVESLPEGVFDGYRDALIGIHQRLFPHRRTGSVGTERWLNIINTKNIIRIHLENIEGLTDGFYYVAMESYRMHLVRCREVELDYELEDANEEEIDKIRRALNPFGKAKRLYLPDFKVLIAGGKEVITHPEGKEGYGYRVQHFTDARACKERAYDAFALPNGNLLLTFGGGKAAVLAPVYYGE
ncbi:MAG: hypothetical protein WC331_10575 [Candidatus Omnitrophota bacterium]